MRPRPKLYKEKLSGYRQWHQLKHAEEYVLHDSNIGENLSIDETSLSNGEVYTVVTNKAAKGRKGALVTMIKGVASDNVIEKLKHLGLSKRRKVQTVTADLSDSMKYIASKAFPSAEQISDRFHVQQLMSQAIDEMRIELRWEGTARLNLARWYNRVAESGSDFRSFNTIAATFYEHSDEIINYFDNRSTNASAESINSKIKAFQAKLHGVNDTKFFIFRLCNLYA